MNHTHQIRRHQWFVAIALAMVVAIGGCNEQNRVATWLMTSSHTDLAARVGMENDGTEVGAVVKYGVADDIKWGPEPEIAGGYILFHLTQDVTIEDYPDHSPLKPFLDLLHTRPYAGLEIVGSTDSRARNAQPNWIAGTAFTLTESDAAALIVEYSDGDQATGDVYIGGVYRF